jgi:hypothetical protein
MLSDSQGRVLKFVADRPPLATQLGDSLLSGRALSQAELSAPLPSLFAPGVGGYSSPRDVLRSNLLRRLEVLARASGSSNPTPAVSPEVGEVKAVMTRDALVIEDADLLRRLANAKLSPSLVMSLYGCLGSFAVKRFSWAFGLDTDSAEMKRGSAFHEVFEKLMALPAEERTTERAKKFAEEVLSSRKYELISGDPEQIKWLSETVEKAFSFRRPGQSPESPADTVLFEMPDGKLPLEVPISGSIGGAKRETFGIIDRIAVAPDGSVVVQDYKTGSKMKPYNLSITKRSGKNAGKTIPRLPEVTVSREGLESWSIPDGFREAFQQYSYLVLAEQNGLGATQAELLFPAVDDALNVAPVPPLLSSVENPSDEAVAFDAWVKEAYSTADEKVDELASSGVFPFAPSFLCSWCPLAKMCPQFQPHSGKGAEVAAGQPDFVPHIAPLTAD